MYVVDGMFTVCGWLLGCFDCPNRFSSRPYPDPDSELEVRNGKLFEIWFSNSIHDLIHMYIYRFTSHANFLHWTEQSRFLFLPQIHDASPRVATEVTAVRLAVILRSCFVFSPVTRAVRSLMLRSQSVSQSVSQWAIRFACNPRLPRQLSPLA